MPLVVLKKKEVLISKEVIDLLITNGYNIEYEMITNVSNEVVLDKIKSCDIILDEVYSDTPLGGIAVEGALNEKTCYCFWI